MAVVLQALWPPRRSSTCQAYFPLRHDCHMTAGRARQLRRTFQTQLSATVASLGSRWQTFCQDFTACGPGICTHGGDPESSPAGLHRHSWLRPGHRATGTAGRSVGWDGGSAQSSRDRPADQPTTRPDAAPGCRRPPAPSHPGRRSGALHLRLHFEVLRALGGNTLSWAYVFEWPIFAGFAIYMWWNLLHGHDGVDGRAAVGPTTPARPSEGPA